mmetsp:Transcript_31487/g.64045  ORF Transcript_31487/g.64045 Transcript_31487/m.64045 type:complete len:350 (+) Transcript_31487:495-1544(+)
MAITRSSSKQQKKGMSTGGAAKRPPKKANKTKATKNRGTSIPVDQASLSKLPRTERIVRMLGKVATIGGLVSPECLDHHPMAEGIFKMLKEKGNEKLWMFLQVESFCEVRDKEIIENKFGECKDVPVLISIRSEVEPISYYASCSTQVQSTSFSDFKDKSLKWIEVLPGVNFLQTTQSTKFLFGSTLSTAKLSFEFAILPIRRPSQIASLVPDEVQTVSTVYKGISITCALKKSEVNEIIEREESLTQEDDREAIIAKLKEEKNKSQQINQAIVDEEKRRYGEMIDSLVETNGMDRATVETNLEEMKVCKIYSSSIPAQKMTWMGLKTGFDTSNAMVNRFVGKADKVYS